MYGDTVRRDAYVDSGSGIVGGFCRNNDYFI